MTESKFKFCASAFDIALDVLTKAVKEKKYGLDGGHIYELANIAGGHALANAMSWNGFPECINGDCKQCWMEKYCVHKEVSKTLRLELLDSLSILIASFEHLPTELEQIILQSDKTKEECVKELLQSIKEFLDNPAGIKIEVIE